MTGYAAHPFDSDDANNSFRANNSVKYVSPTIAGLSGSVLYGFSNTPGQFANNRMVSFGVGYRQGPLRLNGAYINVNNPGVGTSVTAPSDGYYGPLPAIPAGRVARQTIYGGGTAYAFGSLDVTAMYSHVRFEAITGGDLTFANYDMSLHYRVTPAFALALCYVYTPQRSTVESGANTHYHQLAAFADYSLSKTVDIYAHVVYQKAAGNAPAFINGTPKAPSSSNH
jgi:predicted porin